MRLNAKDRQFLDRRRAINRGWPWLLFVMMTVIVCGWFYCLFFVPQIANPLYVVQLIRQGGLPKPLLNILAAVSPVLFGLVCILMLVFLSFGVVSRAQESRLLGIFEKSLPTKSDKIKDVDGWTLE